MKFSTKRKGRKVDAYPIDANGRVSTISKGPAPRGSTPLKKNVTQFKVPVVPPAKPEVKATPTLTSGVVKTHEETHENE